MQEVYGPGVDREMLSRLPSRMESELVSPAVSFTSSNASHSKMGVLNSAKATVSMKGARGMIGHRKRQVLAKNGGKKAAAGVSSSSPWLELLSEEEFPTLVKKSKVERNNVGDSPASMKQTELQVHTFMEEVGAAGFSVQNVKKEGRESKMVAEM